MSSRLIDIVLLLGVLQTAHAHQQETLRVTVLDSITSAALDGANVDLIQGEQVVGTSVTAFDGVASFSVTIVSKENLPSFGFQLGFPYPNPAFDRTSIPLTLERPGDVEIELYDLLGRRVATTSSTTPAGTYEIIADLSGLAVGTYIARVVTEDRAVSRRVVRTGFGGTAPSLTILSRSRLSSETVAFKGLNGADDYQLRIRHAGYIEGLLDITMPRDKDFTAWLIPATTTAIGMKLVRIPAGTFQMGSNTINSAERPVHEVTMTTDFWFGKYEVTQGEYLDVTGQRPSYFSGDTLPVENVSWFDAIAFANTLSTSEGLSPCYGSSGNVQGGDVYACTGYRLPTEAEWEYAARAGTTNDLFFGDDLGRLGDYAWYRNNSGYSTHPVGQKMPNPWGLYDVYGNVWERNHDWYGNYSGDPVSNPPGPKTGFFRAMRGGGWFETRGFSSAFRPDYGRPDRTTDVGFRLARSAHGEPANLAPEPPSQPSPADGSAGISLTPNLTWTSSDPDGDGLTFKVYFGEVFPVPLLTTVGETSYSPSVLAEGTVYRWYIVASDGQDERVGPVWTFTTAPSGGGTPFEQATNFIGMEMVRIPAGFFQMGSDNGLLDEHPVHAVTLTTDFWIGKHEVTQGQYRAVTGLSPSQFSGDDMLPVERVSWFDAIEFANALSASEGLSPCYESNGDVLGGDVYECNGYRLPTEAEWEYAARAGTTTAYSFGDGWGQHGVYAWYSSNSGSRTHPVGQKLPNPWGLYDVHGNVWEWIHDRYGSSYYSGSSPLNPSGPTEGSHRVIRGGGWSYGASFLRSASRYDGRSESRLNYSGGGFRIARTDH